MHCKRCGRLGQPSNQIFMMMVTAAFFKKLHGHVDDNLTGYTLEKSHFLTFLSFFLEQFVVSFLIVALSKRFLEFVASSLCSYYHLRFF